MVPSPRSSAPSTPISKVTSTNASPTTPQTTPRKTPHCTKCHRPRAGHPRQGCPYVDSPTVAKATENIANALESLHIEPRGAKVTSERRIRRSSVKPQPAPEPEASLASLTSDSSEVLNRLLQPGIMDDVEEDEDERKATVARWQDTLARAGSPTTPGRRKSGRMPGTLITPSTTKTSLEPDGFNATQMSLQSEIDETKPTVRMPGTFVTSSKLSMEPTALDLNATQESSTAHVSSASSKHLMRSMSVEERDEFLNDLVKTSKAPPATAFVLPMGETLSAQTSANKLGFYSRVFDLKNGEGWLFIGMNREAVDDLFTGVNSGVKMNVGGAGFKAVAGGVVAGAVATWTGLAFA